MITISEPDSSRILIIDDNESIHHDFDKIVASAGSSSASLDAMRSVLFGLDEVVAPPPKTFRIDHALQGEEGLAMVRQAGAEGRPYSVAFVDSRMPPGWDGVETIGYLWEVSPDLQVVLCTAYTDHSWQDIRRIFGERDNLLFLKKPFDIVEVLQLMQALSCKWEMNQEIQGRLRQLAYYDNLTGLPNRAQFLERLTQTLSLAARHQQKAGLLFIDLDNFKRINDTLGHSVGDLLLQAIANRLVNSLRWSDTVANTFDGEIAGRLGGDEFTVILPKLLQHEDAGRVAQRIVDHLGKPLILEGHEIVVTPSIGIAIYPDDGEDVHTLIKNADLAMYNSKRVGPNMFTYFKESMNAAALQRMTLESHLRHAFECREFSLHYQPQFDLTRGRVIGMEALLRWHNWELGEIPPLDFIPIAEENGMIIPIGEWVFRTACSQFKIWLEQGLPLQRISVNVSVKQFIHPDFVRDLEKVLTETALKPQFVELEITESLLVGESMEIYTVLNELRELGVRAAIDDFGTGYSSLKRLKDLPIDCLKIDKSFVQAIHGGVRDRSIVSAIIAMARAIGLNVIAEGVETAGQFDFLRDQSCDEVQGFLMSYPMDVAKADIFLQKSFLARVSK